MKSISQFWDTAIVPTLVDYIRIPAKSPHFDKDWAKNGRLVRILSTLMALQAGLPLLDFSPMAGRGTKAYFAAIQAGLDRNYAPMERIFSAIIGRSPGPT